MIDRKTLFLLAGLFILSAAFYMSVSTTFMVLLLGLIIVPPALMISAAMFQGFSIVSESLSKSGKEERVVSV